MRRKWRAGAFERVTLKKKDLEELSFYERNTRCVVVIFLNEQIVVCWLKTSSMM